MSEGEIIGSEEVLLIDKAIKWCMAEATREFLEENRDEVVRRAQEKFEALQSQAKQTE